MMSNRRRRSGANVLRPGLVEVGRTVATNIGFALSMTSAISWLIIVTSRPAVRS
jgi:hypothetical protein